MITTDPQILAAELGSVGWLVLEDLFPGDFIAELRDACMPLLAEYARFNAANRGANRHQMFVPFAAPFDDARLIENDRVLAIVDSLIGDDCECTYYGSDTPLPGSDFQRPHQDGAPLFPDWDVVVPPYSLAFNVPLVDVTLENGPLECFPGVEAPDRSAEPVRFTVPAGTAILRDTRIWHRGSPNRSSEPRPMLALLYNRPWYRFPLDRPRLSAARYDALSPRGRRLFQGAVIDAAR